MGQPLVLGLQRVPLLLARVELVEFAELPQQPLAFAGQRIGLRARLLQGLLCLAPGAPGGIHRA